MDASRDTVAAMAGHSEAMSARVGQIAQACAALSEAVTVTRQQEQVKPPTSKPAATSIA